MIFSDDRWEDNGRSKAAEGFYGGVMNGLNEKPPINVDYFEDLTGDVPEVDVPTLEAIGDRIRTLREARGLSLDALSKMTGFEVERLSAIEKKEVQPQLGTILRLSKALDSAFSRLISGVGNRLYAVTRKDERKSVSRSTARKSQKQIYSYQSLAPEVQGRHMEALIVTLEENPGDDRSVHEGEEFIFVLHGTVEMHIGEDVFDLYPGDSIYYLSTTPHLIAGKGGRATILAVIYSG
jgi:transcriptional regulator with XRE-family HTH domain